MQFEKFRPTLEILRLIAELDEFKGYWKAFSATSSQTLSTLKEQAIKESIASSARIEGISLDHEEMAGFADLMKNIIDDWQEIALTESQIKEMHTLLLKYSSRSKLERGHYKSEPNHVEAFDHDGNSMGAVFPVVSPFDTPFRMTELVNWTNESLRRGEIHPLLVIAVFDLVFLTIHPFKYGNARLCRALTTLLLLKAGYAHIAYSSLENIIEANKEGYYLALKRTEMTLVQNEPEWQIWILFFLHCMQKQKAKLQAKIQGEEFLEDDLPSLSIKILETVRKKGRAKISEIEELTGESRSTIKIRLNELIEQALLERHGRGPATWYSLPRK